MVWTNKTVQIINLVIKVWKPVLRVEAQIRHDPLPIYKGVWIYMSPRSASRTLKYDPKGLGKSWVRRLFNAKCWPKMAIYRVGVKSVWTHSSLLHQYSTSNLVFLTGIYQEFEVLSQKSMFVRQSWICFVPKYFLVHKHHIKRVWG